MYSAEGRARLLPKHPEYTLRLRIRQLLPVNHLFKLLVFFHLTGLLLSSLQRLLLLEYSADDLEKPDTHQKFPDVWHAAGLTSRQVQMREHESTVSGNFFRGPHNAFSHYSSTKSFTLRIRLRISPVFRHHNSCFHTDILFQSVLSFFHSSNYCEQRSTTLWLKI